MQFRRFCEDSWAEMNNWALAQQSHVLKHPYLQVELAKTGRITIRSIQQQLGYTEGQAAFMVRHLDKEGAFDDQKYASYQRSMAAPKEDGFFYHVTLKAKLPAILKDGLKPNSPSMFTNYATYSSGKIFLCDRDGVQFWKGRIEEHAFHNGQPVKTAVVRIDKKDILAPRPDKAGSEDSGRNSYYTTEPIPAWAIKATRL